MPAKMPNEVEKDAKEYAVKKFSTVNFHLGDIVDADMYKKIADTILGQLMVAYGEGYYAGVEDQRKRK